jgi:predicted amidophosphoribosyltransferase
MSFTRLPWTLCTIQSSKGKRLVLVDDVMTSGATLEAATACLGQAGAVHMTTLVFARAEPGR